MALFTLQNASGNPLKYEQLNSEETITAASSLPTSAATQMATGTEKSALQGTALQAVATAPLRPMMGNGADTAGAGFNPAANATGSYGAQADSQSFNGVATTYAPNAAGLSPSGGFSSADNGGDIAQSSTSSAKTDVSNVQVTINNPPGANPPDVPNPPTNPPVNPPSGSHNPDVTVDLNTGLLPNVHADINVGQTLQPVTTLVEATVNDLLSGNPQTVTNLVTNTLGTVDNLLTGGGLNVALGDLPLLGQGNGGGSAQLINLGVGDTGNTPVAPLLDTRILQNLPSLSETSLQETVQNVTEAVPTLLQNPLGNLSGTLSGILGGGGPLAEITLGGDNSSAEGVLADLNLLDNLPLTGIPVVGGALESIGNAVPLGNGTLADALSGDNQLLGISVGDNNGTPSLLADVNLLGSDTLASVSVPLVGAEPLIEVPLDANGLPDVAATLENTLEGIQSAAENLPEVLTQTASGLLDGVTSTLPDLLAEDGLGTATSQLTDILGDTLDTATDAASSLPVAGDIISDLTDTLGALLENPSSANPLEHVAESTSHLAGNVTDAVTNILDPLTDATSHIPVAGDILAGVTETLSTPLDILTQVAELPAGDIPSGDIITALLETTTTTVGAVTETTSSVVETATATTAQVTETLLQPLECTPLEPLADVVSTLAGTATSTVENTVQQTTSAVTSVVENTTGAVGNLLGNIVNTVTNPAPATPPPAPANPITKIISPFHGLFG